MINMSVPITLHVVLDDKASYIKVVTKLCKIIYIQHQSSWMGIN